MDVGRGPVQIAGMAADSRPGCRCRSVMSVAGGFVLKHQVNVRTEELRVSAQRYRQLFESNPVPMLIYQRGTYELLAVNDAFVNQYGYSAEEARALHLQDLYPEEEKKAITEVAAGLKAMHMPESGIM